MAPRSGRALVQQHQRLVGVTPFALQRALELQAAFHVFFDRLTVTDDAALRRRLATMSHRDLHGAVARCLGLRAPRRKS